MTSKRSIRLFLAAFFAFGPILGSLGCETKGITIALRSFGNGNVDGVWIWRLSETSGQYERACRLELSELQTTSSGAEVLPYLQVCDQPGEWGLNLQARIYRLPADPTTIVVKLFYFRWADPGQFRASAYNAAGESPLSATTLAF